MFLDKFLVNRELKPAPLAQKLLAEGFFRWDYMLAETDIIIEDIDLIPTDKKVIFVMNHPNMYNYLPFMYQLYRTWKDDGIGNDFPTISTFIKAKYFHKPFLGHFLAAANGLPLPSRGYFLGQDFYTTMKRMLTNDEYRLLRDLVDERINIAHFLRNANLDLCDFVTQPHQGFNPQQELYKHFVEREYMNLMGMITRITRDGLLNQKSNLLIFPEGCIATRLQKGQIGAAQLALNTGVPIVPIGANGLDACYPDSLPFAKSKRVVYRVGKPLTLADDLAPFAINESFEPFSQEAKAKFGPQFRQATDLIMKRINDLLDPVYRYAPHISAPLLQGAWRFV